MKESPVGSGKYEIVLEPGSYAVFVKKIGYVVHREEIVTRAGINRVPMRV